MLREQVRYEMHAAMDDSSYESQSIERQSNIQYEIGRLLGMYEDVRLRHTALKNQRNL